MTPSPDVTVNVLSASTSRTPPTGTGTAFFAGVTQRGDNTQPILCRSLSDFATRFGARLTTSALYDAVDAFFGEGGTSLYVSRVFGAGAVAATLNLLDSGAGVSLVVKAGSYGVPDVGTWGNGVQVAVLTSADDTSLTGSQFKLSVAYGGVEVERSYALATQADAIAWARSNSNYVVVTLGATALIPARISATSLASGTDGTAVADADWQAALDRIVNSYGPGQVAAPGRTTTVGQLQLLDHAQAHDRFALMDAADTSSDTTLVGAAQGLFTAPNNGRRYGQLLAPWDVIPGLTANTTRTVPPCARLAAQYARNDALGNPNQAAAGRYGIARYVLDLSQPNWTKEQRDNLHSNGVTISRRRFGGVVETFDAVTLADQQQDSNWMLAPNVRTVMAFVALANVIGDAHEFDQLDGQGHSLSSLQGDLIAAANSLYAVGALFGRSPAEAFYVDVGSSVNTPTTEAQGKMVANVALRTSSAALNVTINVTKYPITQAIG